MKKRFNVIAAAVLALGMVVGMCGCEGQLPQRSHTPLTTSSLARTHLQEVHQLTFISFL